MGTGKIKIYNERFQYIGNTSDWSHISELTFLETV